MDVSQKTDTNIRCTRCGRVLSVNTHRINVGGPVLAGNAVSVPQPYLDDDDTMFTVQNDPTDPNDTQTQDPTVTLSPTVTEVVDYLPNDHINRGKPEHDTKTFDPMGRTSEADFEIDIPGQKKSLPTSPYEPNPEAETIMANDKPGSPSGQQGSGLGSGGGSGMRTSKLDLSQRVMATIDKPSAPFALADNSGAYGVHRIVRTHQKGGMGRILIVYDQYLKRDVALKELHPEVANDESVVRRFIGEAEITAQLEHPGIVPVHTLGLYKNEYPYYTMKLIKGKTFQDAIKDYHRKPSKQELLNLVRRLVSICKTMTFAHNKGVIHRDLKPANIMLGEHGETLVMDWGLAKPFHVADDETMYTAAVQHHATEPRPELTMVGAIVGTPAFMSPEQASPEKYTVGPLADIFSLGTVLYYLLTGQTAFSGRSTQEVLAKVRAASPPKPSEIKPNVPSGLEAICAKAMAKEPEDRYQSAGELVDELCRWLDNEPIKAQKENILQKIWRWIDHHRAISILVPFSLVLIVIVTIIAINFDRIRRTDLHQAMIASILNDPVDLTDFPSVSLEGSTYVSVTREPRQTGGLLVACRVKEVPHSKQGAVVFGSPEDADWDLSQCRALTFSLFEASLSDNPDGLTQFFIRIGNGSSYYEYRPDATYWEKRKRSNWFPFSIPLAGSPDWIRTESGIPTISQIRWIEFHFDAKEPVSFNLDYVTFIK